MSLELNKIAASVLTAGVVAMGSGFVAEILVHPHVPEEPHYKVAATEPAEDGAPAEPEGPQPVLPLLASADPAAGEQATRACQACHSFDKGDPNKVGPNLFGIVGEKIAGVEGFNYSDALAGKEGAWTYENLNAFLHDPQGWAPGTIMTYGGISDAQKRADLIAYLRQNDDSPAELPTEEEIAAVTGGAEAAAEEKAATGEASAGAEEAEAADGAAQLAQRLQGASAEAGEKAVRVCQACHSFDKGGPNKVGPNLYDVVGAKIAGVEGFSYSDALKGKDGEWTYAKLDAYLENPQGWAQGTRMTFPGVKDPAKRADVIMYLRAQSDDPPPLPEADGEKKAEAEDAQETAEAETAKAQDAEAQPASGEDAAGGGDGLVQQIAAADPATGEKAVRVCQACHSFNKGGPNKVGPNLYGVVGAEIAAVDGFTYSSALENKDGDWTYAKLDAFLENPQGWAKGTRMTYPGVKDAGKRAAVIAYLRQQAENPPPLK